MATIAILEGMNYNNNNFYNELLGRAGFLRRMSRKAKRVVKRVTLPIRKFTRPVTAPLDRMLKRIPVVRTLYRAGITASYAKTFQFGKVIGAAKRTFKSAKRDFKGAKRIVMLLADKIVGPLVRKYGAKFGKTKIKAIAIPPATAAASAQIGPWAIPFIAAAVNASINKFFAMLKRNLKRLGKKITATPHEAKKMEFMPEVPPSPNFAPSQTEYMPEKKAINPLLLAIPAIAMLMA